MTTLTAISALNGIHEMTLLDLSLTRVLAESFFRESDLPGEFNWGHWFDSWYSIILKKLGTIFCYFEHGVPVAVIGGLTYRCLNTGDPEIIEAFWYCLPEHRKGTKAIRLFERFEQWGRDIGAVRCKMAHLERLSPATVAEMYRRRGYVQQETTYRREL